MAGHGGARPGGGRPKGSKNKRNDEVRAKLERRGCDPILGMVDIAEEAMREGTKDLPLALNCYKELAQYIVPKLKATELDLGEAMGAMMIKWMNDNSNSIPTEDPTASVSSES